MRKSKKTPPVVLENKKKAPIKKGKHPIKKNSFKENIEPTVLKEKTNMYDSMNSCEVLNMTQKDIYERLYEHKMTEHEMKVNNYPSDGYLPRNLVAADSNLRSCVRCGTQFEVYNGTYLSSSKCRYHSKKAAYGPRSQVVKTYPCCGKIIGETGCTECINHVTVEHGPRHLTRTASRKYLQHKVFSLDCEMSYTTGGMEVTRIGLVDVDGLTVYHSYVKPKNKILDYNTEYSGVAEHHLRNVTTTLDGVKKDLDGIIQEDTILVGHALNNDLAALGLIHKTVVDTSVLYKNERQPWRKRSLKSLASEFLSITIQDDPSGHDCIGDARTALRLALLKVTPKTPSMAMPFVPMVPEPRMAEHFSCAFPEPLMQIQNYPPVTMSCGIPRKHPYYNTLPTIYYSNVTMPMRRCV